ncbi:Uncharacterised protein [Mycobacteroides abscessus subsp. abscessus]|nr:Uncharacterised protein [Mycobacteroides abscessus subsp. abscessus]
MMQKHPTYFRMDGGQRLKVMVMLQDAEKRIQFIADLLNSLLKTFTIAFSSRSNEVLSHMRQTLMLALRGQGDMPFDWRMD